MPRRLQIIKKVLEVEKVATHHSLHFQDLRSQGLQTWSDIPWNSRHNFNGKQIYKWTSPRNRNNSNKIQKKGEGQKKKAQKTCWDREFSLKLQTSLIILDTTSELLSNCWKLACDSAFLSAPQLLSKEHKQGPVARARIDSCENSHAYRPLSIQLSSTYPCLPILLICQEVVGLEYRQSTLFIQFGFSFRWLSRS